MTDVDGEIVPNSSTSSPLLNDGGLQDRICFYSNIYLVLEVLDLFSQDSE